MVSDRKLAREGGKSGDRDQETRIGDQEECHGGRKENSVLRSAARGRRCELRAEDEDDDMTVSGQAQPSANARFDQVVLVGEHAETSYQFRVRNRYHVLGFVRRRRRQR